jgi:hypothetical protein
MTDSLLFLWYYLKDLDVTEDEKTQIRREYETVKDNLEAYYKLKEFWDALHRDPYEGLPGAGELWNIEEMQ